MKARIHMELEFEGTLDDVVANVVFGQKSYSEFRSAKSQRRRGVYRDCLTRCILYRVDDDASLHEDDGQEDVHVQLASAKIVTKCSRVN